MEDGRRRNTIRRKGGGIVERSRKNPFARPKTKTRRLKSTGSSEGGEGVYLTRQDPWAPKYGLNLGGEIRVNQSSRRETEKKNTKKGIYQRMKRGRRKESLGKTLVAGS